MNPTRWAVVLLLVLVVSNAAWLYTSLDRGVSIEHQSGELAHQRRKVELLSQLVVDLPREASQDEMYRILRERYPDRVVKSDSTGIEIDNIVLQFRDGRLVRVSPL